MTYLMKVFSHCPCMKMWKFSKRKDNEQHSTGLDCGSGTLLVPKPASIQVWGIASFYFLLGLSTTFM